MTLRGAAWFRARHGMSSNDAFFGFRMWDVGFSGAGYGWMDEEDLIKGSERRG
jgi:hypothetical protein